MNKSTLLILPLFLLAGCKTAVLDEPPSEFDIRTDVLAVVSPDTVEVGELFTVQMSFPQICGGTFSRVDEFVGSNQITLTPVWHVVPQRVCPDVFQIQTVTKQVHFVAAGRNEVIASGRYFDLRKTVVAVSSYQKPDNFRIRFFFVNQYGAKKINQQSSFAFINREPRELTTIQSDSSGIWETTFTDTLSSVRYTLGGSPFEVKRGIKDAGVILFP